MNLSDEKYEGNISMENKGNKRGEKDFLKEKDFFFIESSRDDYNILFHEPSSRFAKVNKSFDTFSFSEQELAEHFNYLGVIPHEDKNLEMGIGRIGMTFMSARTCNLGCKYCFAGTGEYGSVEDKPKLYTYENYMKAIKTGIKMYPEGIKSISFFGGEPLLNIKDIIKFVPDCIQFFENNNLPTPQFAISTNLIAITDEIARFFAHYNINCVISLDGPKEINDMARVPKYGEMSVYDKVVEGCNILDRNGVSYVVQATINKHHMDSYVEGYAIKWAKELERINWENIAVVPVETDLPDLKIQGENLEKLDLFTRELTNYYIQKLYGKDIDKIASGIIAPILQIAKQKHVNDCSSGHSVFCDTDSNVYPCQMFCNNDAYKLGNLNEGWSGTKVSEIVSYKRMGTPECNNCISRNICFMWCKGIQLLSKGEIFRVCEPRCVFQKANTEECIKTLARLTRGTQEYEWFWKNYRKVGEYLRRDGFITE